MANILEESTQLFNLLTAIRTGMRPKDLGFAQMNTFLAILATSIENAQRKEAENATELFIHGNTKLVQVNKQLEKDIEDLDSFNANINAITGVIDGITEFLNIFPVDD